MIQEKKKSNYAYFPILVEDDYPLTRDKLYEKLRDCGIFTRRYFYPLISEFPMYREMASSSISNLPNATVAAQKILCLPIYPELSDEEILRIVSIIANIN